MLSLTCKKLGCLTTMLIISLGSPAAFAWELSDLYSDYRPHASSNRYAASTQGNYTVLNASHYRDTVEATRTKISRLLTELRPTRHQSRNEQVKQIASQLADIPYLHQEGMGEGDWQPASTVYVPDATHVSQNPVYRLDGLDCQTFVQVAMAMLYSRNLDSFDQNLLKIAYGAAGNPNGEIVRYFNRNNFVDGDLNPVNHQTGLLKDVTADGDLAQYADTTTANITRQRWFRYQQHNLAQHVRVLSPADGPLMTKRFTSVYSSLPYPKFDSERVTTTYLPKQALAIRQSDGHYEPNQSLLDAIPTPAVAEIVRNAKRWAVDGVKVKDMIGTETSISHFGLLYRQRFNQGELIYRRISCHDPRMGRKNCEVIPITCQRAHCDELMFAHATDSHPDGYYWYQRENGQYACSAYPPRGNTAYSRCNRVERLPLFSYLTDFQFGSYWYMSTPSILGVHIEKLK